MVETFNKGRQALGKTGEGVIHETDITEELSLEFRNRWGMYDSALSTSE